MGEAEGLAKHDAKGRSSVVPVQSLTAASRAELYSVMSRHFTGVDEQQFFQDLDEKQWIVLLQENGTERITGFSTIMLLETELAGQPIAGVFAGDTIIEPEFWGQSSWLYQWGHCSYELACGSGDPHVGFVLLTSTHRSYRFLPGFFHEYYPHPDRPIPAEVQAKLDALVGLKFPREYNAQTGIVRPVHATPVRPGREDPAATTRDDRHAEFFRRANPRFEQGDFLACFAELTWENLTPLGRRVVRGQS